MAKQDTKLQEILAAGMARVGMNKSRLAIVLGWSDSTLWRRFTRPESMTVDELRHVAKVLRLTADEISSCF